MKKSLFFFVSLITYLVSPTSPVFAQQPKNLGCLQGLGPLGDTLCSLLSPTDVSPASNLLATILSTVIGVFTIVAGIYFLLQFLIAGLDWIGSSGNPEKLKNAQSKITNALIGLIIVVIAYAITSLVGKILGINILNIGATIKSLGPK